MVAACPFCKKEWDINEEAAKKAGAAKCACGGLIYFNTPDGRAPDAPEKLGNYELINLIAQGGMGEIYYAKVSGLEGFERPIAIKRILQHLANDQSFIDMMVKEAKITVLMHHPNIVQVYDLSKDGDSYYIAMEYVPGVTVADLLTERQKDNKILPVPVCLNIAFQMLKGLAYAHELVGTDGLPAGILHRDITPQNILVTQEGWVKVTDFGIAKARNELTNTGPGMIKGKLGYITPEQIAGSVADERIDIFAAGIVLWEMLSGTRLFKGNTEVETFHKVIACEIPHLSTYRTDVSPAIERVVRQALSKDPKTRFQSADEFGTALQKAISPQSTDDALKATKVFFKNRPRFFAPVRAHRESAEVVLSTRALTIPGSDTNHPEITSLTGNRWKIPGTKKPFPRFAIALVLLAGLGFGAWAYMGQPSLSSFLKGPTKVVEKVEKPVEKPVENPITPDKKDDKKQIAKKTPKKRRPKAKVRELTGKDISATIRKASGSISTCLSKLAGKNPPKQVIATITITTEGRVSKASLSPTLPDAGAQSCLIKTLKKLKFAGKPKSDMKVKIPLTIQVL
ncbi:serine/threonine protein kinase [Myxococcota bacterium]|nr:serine/threonine protein kinase [Myxococcota bacterium]